MDQVLEHHAQNVIEAIISTSEKNILQRVSVGG